MWRHPDDMGVFAFIENAELFVAKSRCEDYVDVAVQDCVDDAADFESAVHH